MCPHLLSQIGLLVSPQMKIPHILGFLYPIKSSIRVVVNMSTMEWINERNIHSFNIGKVRSVKWALLVRIHFFLHLFDLIVPPDSILSQMDTLQSITILVAQDGNFQISSLPSQRSPPQCPGSTFKWGLGSPYHIYPFSIHAPGFCFVPNYILITVDPHNSTILVCSLQCGGISYRDSNPCSSCQSIGDLAQRSEDHARKSPANVDHASLSHDQLNQRLEGIEKTLKKERLSVWVSYIPWDIFNCFAASWYSQGPLSTWYSQKKTYEAFSISPARTIFQAFILYSRIRNTIIGVRRSC